MKFLNPLLFTLLSVVVLYGCSENKENNKEVIKYVKTETITPSVEGEKLVFNGYIKEHSLTTLSFRVGGPIIKLNVKTGEYVNKGETIASIDKRDYQLQVRSTKAQYEQVEGEYKRYKELYEKDKIPANSYEKIKSGYLMAKTAYDNARNQLRDTDLKAPFSGYIFGKMTENFQTVGPGVPIVSLMDISKLEVVISIPENLINKVKNSNRNFLSVENSNVSDLPINIVSISEKTGNDGMYEMKLNFNNDTSYNIYPGMSAEVTMHCDKQSGTLKIPATAVLHIDDNNYVWLYNKSTHTVKRVRVDINKIVNNGFIEISSGVNYGDIIVTAGVNYLQDGQKVMPLKKSSKSNVGGLL